MAEFCLDCMNEYIAEKNKKLEETDVTVALDLCEGCGEWKMCVISIKNTSHM